MLDWSSFTPYPDESLIRVINFIGFNPSMDHWKAKKKRYSNIKGTSWIMGYTI